MNEMIWYAELLKPAWAPPSFLFGPVWSVLYAGIALSFGYVFFLYWKKRLDCATVLPFFLNLCGNLAFTPIQFGLRDNFLAAIDITFVLVTLVIALVRIFPRVRWVALVNIPYLLWVTFATVLQFSITVLNWERSPSSVLLP